MSLVPGGAKGFELLIASPRLAYAILRRARKEGNGSSKMLTGRTFDCKPAEATIEDFLDKGIPGLGSNIELETFNKNQADRLAETRKKLKKALSLKDSDILAVPIMFIVNHRYRPKADALTAGMVNMLVLNKHCIIPQPFGPVVGGIDLFEENMRWKLKPLGLTVEFINDWYEYHL